MEFECQVQLLGEFALEGVDQRVEIYTLNTGEEELEETRIVEPEESNHEETVLPPTIESSEKEFSPDSEEVVNVGSTTAEEVLGISEPGDDEGTESSVHIAAPISSTGPLRQPNPRKTKATRVDRGPLIENYSLPPAGFLQEPEYDAAPVDSTEELKRQAITIQKTLQQFGVEVTLGDITKGPTITRFELHPAAGVKMEKSAYLMLAPCTLLTATEALSRDQLQPLTSARLTALFHLSNQHLTTTRPHVPCTRTARPPAGATMHTEGWATAISTTPALTSTK